jgi:hypothetical protein
MIVRLALLPRWRINVNVNVMTVCRIPHSNERVCRPGEMCVSVSETPCPCPSKKFRLSECLCLTTIVIETSFRAFSNSFSPRIHV